MSKQRISEERIIEAAFSILKESGYRAVNARSVAMRMGCSVQPIYSCFGNMDALVDGLYQSAARYYGGYVESHADARNLFASVGKSHILFAGEEKRLFEFLFLSPHLRAKGVEEFFLRYRREDVVRFIRDAADLPQGQAEELYLNMMLYTHGIACLIATEAAHITYEEIQSKVNFACASFLAELRKGTI